MHHINNSKQVNRNIYLKEIDYFLFLEKTQISNNTNNNNNSNHHHHLEKSSNRPSKIKCRRQKHEGYNRYHSGK